MNTNVEVTKNDGESTTALIRRFSKRVQSMGLIPRMRSIRYHARTKSKGVQHKKALKVARRREEVRELIKLGKLTERVPGTRAPKR